MRVMHLSEREATDLAYDFAKKTDTMTHENRALWKFIKEIERTFPGLKWREDRKSFSKGV